MQLPRDPTTQSILNRHSNACIRDFEQILSYLKTNCQLEAIEENLIGIQTSVDILRTVLNFIKNPTY